MRPIGARLWGIALAAIIASACAAPAATSSSAAPSGSAGPTPKRGGTLVVAASADPGQLNTAITTAGGTHFVADSIYSGLIFLDADLTPKPDLADSWTISPDGKTYTFNLHKGVKWHDGVAFSSADVKFSFEQVLLKYHSRTKSGLENVLAGIDTPDANTVVFRFKQPYGPLLQRLDVIEAPIVAKHVYEGQDPTKAEANLKPVGTGPFKLAEYVKGDTVKLVRNPDYFKPGLPYLDALVFKIIPQSATQVLSLERGEVDYVSGISGPDLARLRTNPSFTIAKSGAGSGGSFCITTLIYNTLRAPLDKVEVRQALAYAIDRQQILDQVYFGQGKVATTAINSAIGWAYDPNTAKYPLDPAKANALLDGAGLKKDASGMRFKLNFVHATSFAKVGELMKPNLAAVGIDLQLTPLEVNAANDRTFVAKDFDIGSASYCNGPDPEIGVRRQFVSSNIGPILFSNGASYKNPRVDQLFDQAAAAADKAERAKAYFEIQDILAKDIPNWGLVETEGYRIWSAKFHGLYYWSGDLAQAAWTD
jgi:peptide/nickel transport system substrate-binding protein